MNTQDVLVSSKRIIASIATCFLLIVVFGGGNVICQETEMIKKRMGSGLEITNYTEIPEATEPCTPLECEWWKQMREAGNDLLRKGDDKTKKKYALLFVEGIEKAYRLPLADRPPHLLVFRRPAQSPRDIIPKNGEVELSVEVRADGSVGEVRGQRSALGYGSELHSVTAPEHIPAGCKRPRFCPRVAKRQHAAFGLGKAYDRDTLVLLTSR